jgi:hypothetical protein
MDDRQAREDSFYLLLPRRIQYRVEASVSLGRSRTPTRTLEVPWETKMANSDPDQSVLGSIDSLVKEEERLYAKKQLTSEDEARLAEIKVHLDQCWDLLRQRRALREFGEDPDEAKVRPVKIVENYEQ